jgi:hypothetical protein
LLAAARQEARALVENARHGDGVQVGRDERSGVEEVHVPSTPKLSPA